MAVTADGSWVLGVQDTGVWASYDKGNTWAQLTDIPASMSYGRAAWAGNKGLALVADRSGWQVLASTELAPPPTLAPTPAPTTSLRVLDQKKDDAKKDGGGNTVAGIVVSTLIGVLVVGVAGFAVFKAKSSSVSPGR